MPRIPTAQQTVATQVPDVGSAQKAPGAIKGAFVQDTSAIESGINSLATIVQKKTDQMAQVKNSELESEFMLGQQDILHNNRTKVVKDENGNDITIPDGIGDRVGYQTKDAAAEYEKRMADLNNQIMKKAPMGIYASQLRNSITGHYLSGRGTIIAHEASEMRKADVDTIDTNIKMQQESVKGNPNNLLMAIDNIKQENLKKKNRTGVSVANAELATNEDISKAALNAGVSMLETGSTLDETMRFMDSEEIRKQIPSDKYAQLKTDLETKSRQITGLKDWQTKQAQTQGAFDMTQLLMNHTLTPDKVRSFQQAGVIDTETASIFNSAAKNKSFTPPENMEKQKADYFLSLIDESIKDKNDNATMKALKDATSAYGKNDLGYNQYAYFISEANKKFQNEKNGKGWSDAFVAFSNSAKALKDFAISISGVKKNSEMMDLMVNKLLSKVTAGISPTVAAKEVQKEAVLQLHPQAVGYPESGKTTMDKNGVIKIITPEGEILDQPPKKENKAGEKKNGV